MIAALALTAAIALSPIPAFATEVPVDRGPAVQFERSGGFTGWVTRLSISPNGRATVVEGRTGARHHFTLTPREKRQVTRRIAAADLPDIAGHYTTAGAADLFVYSIASDGSRVVADQLALPKQAEPLVRTLTRLIDPSRWSDVSTAP